MLDAFEARLADLLADALPGQGFGRGPVSLPADPAAVAASVRIAFADAAPQLAALAPREVRRPDGVALRAETRLRGEILIELAGQAGLLPLLDRILPVLHRLATGEGGLLEEDEARGFALQYFGFVRFGPVPQRDRVLAVACGFDGRFWPVQPEPDGPAITRIPLRIAVLPAGVPQGLTARAGGADLTVPLALDLRASGGAASRVVARLAGAAPPGSLLGESVNVPPGHVGVPVDADGIARLRYRPPAVLAAPASVEIATALAHGESPLVNLASIAIAVLP